MVFFHLLFWGEGVRGDRRWLHRSLCIRKPSRKYSIISPPVFRISFPGYRKRVGEQINPCYPDPIGGNTQRRIGKCTWGIRDIQRLPTTPFSFSITQEIFLLSTERLSRSTLHLKGGEGESQLLYSVVVQLWCPASTPLGIVTKSPKVGPLLIFSISVPTL